MAGLPWFEMDVGFHDSPKVKALAARLREPLADAYVARIYAYCYRHAKDRFEPHDAAVTLEDAAVWRGRRGALVDVLFGVGILERDAGKVVVHGVAERLGPHIAKRIADAKRQRERRTKAAASIGRHGDGPRDVTRDVRRESRSDKDKDTEATTHTQGADARESGAADRQAIEDLRGQKPHPLTDDLVKGLRARGIEPMYPKNGARGAVEAAIREAGVPVAVERVAAAWDTTQPWLTFYLQAIAGRAPTIKSKPAPNINAPAGIGQEWGKPPF